MALYDNKFWLLSHIRNSFISTDDTEMCELVMASENLPNNLVETLNYYPDTDDSQEEDDIEHASYDIQLDMDFNVRHRSNTAARLEKMDLARKRAAKTKNVKWQFNSTAMSAEERQEFFKKEDNVKKKTLQKPKSLLAEQIEKCMNLPQNPYMEYGKFDGSAQMGIPTRKYRIFLTMLPEEQRNYPMNITCIATAKIQDLIGLTLLKFSAMHGDFPLQQVNNYGLYITEEDGEVDRDFPCLDPKECVAKFGFNCLGLVEDKNVKSVQIDTSDQDNVIEHVEEHQNEASTEDDVKQIAGNNDLLDVYKSAIQAPSYKLYRVYIINKMLSKVEIHLGISGDKIEIDPVQQKSSKFAFVRQKAVSHHIDSVASCEVIDTKSNKTTFRVIYSLSFGNSDLTGTGQACLQSSASFKHYDFEADTLTAEEIVQKINLILEMRSSSSRKEYLRNKEKKQIRRRSFHLSK